jgi:hypothetical protein
MALCLSLDASAQSMIFGIHVHKLEGIPKTATMGFQAIRLWDTFTRWADLTPERNLYRLDHLDAELQASAKGNLKTILVLGSTPAWASARPGERCAYGLGCAAEPLDTADWQRHVSTIATTYRGRVECYEPWNEVSFPTDPAFSVQGAGGESGDFFTGSIAKMVELSRVAYESVKRSDPGACVLSPSFHSSGNWPEKFDRYLAAGGGQYVDVVSQHFYVGNEPEEAVPVIRAMRDIMTKHGLVNVPLWNTEVGAPLLRMARERGVSPEQFTYAFMLRTYLVDATEGVSRVYWYAIDDGVMGFVDPNTRNDFGTQAAMAVLNLLAGLKFAQCESAATVWTCNVITATRSFKVTWVSGKGVAPVARQFDLPAERWGPTKELFPAGTSIALDGRPVIIESPHQ